MTKFFGLFSVLPAGAAIVLGVYAAYMAHPAYAIAYAATIAIVGYIVPRAFCAKCPHAHDATCAHVVPGTIAAFFPLKKPCTYTLAEIALTGIPIALIVLVPQYWLWLHTPQFIAFWACMIVSTVLVMVFVCPKCANKSCPFHRQSRRGDS